MRRRKRLPSYRLHEPTGQAVVRAIPFNMGNRQKHGLFEKNRGRELRKTEPDCKKPRKIGHFCMLRGLVVRAYPESRGGRPELIEG